MLAVEPTVAVTVSRFQLPLRTEYVDGRRWLLCDAFTFGSVVLQRVVAVPAGFMTDFASIPRVLWNLLPPTGTYGKAAVIHDFLYRTPFACTRKEADQVLAEAMADLGVRWITRQIIYRAVRAGGRRSYHGLPPIATVSLADVDRYTRNG